MRGLRTTLGVAALLAASAAASGARADGCYICERGSASACRDYCRYRGADTWDNRHRCERRGCRIGGATSCPSAVNYRVCMAPARREPLAVCDREHPNG